MFKGVMRRGLHGRLVAKGVNPVLAFELANIVYPGSDPTVSKPPIVVAKEASRIVEDFLDRGTITEQQMSDRMGRQGEAIGVLTGSATL